MNLYHDQIQDQAAYETLRKIYLIERSEFAVTVLRVLKEFADVEKLKEQLIQIAADGEISPHEVSEFELIMREMVELEKQICELKYFAMRHGIDVEDIMPEKEVVA